ncbi:hypothetical protein WT09_15345 [Burkholderia stagnalis]|nr:hypothetical protein WT07_01415 [Burkholderia stagnalis]KVN15346.1 hypothetical protein WT09_15345 [Burkholderia stagnalis]KWE12049.1 hypothetical protein WT47_05940 [Burkholderia stagnalis]KWE20887.1 hypothetical protein WT48_09110 [Burkholderia stagnalis]KWO72660.1 hypothetical protein WU00_15305 [Burkholderia stagnalis]
MQRRKYKQFTGPVKRQQLLIGHMTQHSQLIGRQSCLFRHATDAFDLLRICTTDKYHLSMIS